MDVGFVRPGEVAADPSSDAKAAEAPYAPEPVEERARAAAQIEADAEAARVRWLGLAQRGEWGEVRAPMAVFRQKPDMKVNPRECDDYRSAVLDDLGLNDASKFPHLSAQDLAAAREVIWRVAPGLWRKDSEFTTVRHFQHVC